MRFPLTSGENRWTSTPAVPKQLKVHRRTELRNKAGETQKAADHASSDCRVPTKQASRPPPPAASWTRRKPKSKIVAAGGDASVLDDLVEYADALATSAQRYVLDAQIAVG